MGEEKLFEAARTKCVVEMEGNQTVLHPAISNVNKGDPR
uniref:Uncharacterized protein n=1 Tax=Fundulus heteroclitus TaxID=8078 RepID=A0A3Q2P341_FUNHE